MTIRLRLLLSVIALCFATAAADSSYTNRSAGFSMRLPGCWIISEGEAAQEMAGLRARLEPAVRSEQIVASFLKAEAGTISSTFPKLVIQWQPDAEVGLKQFRAIHAFRGAVEKTVARGLGFKDERGVCRYADFDPKRNALSFTFPCQEGEVLGVGYSFATSQGLVNIYCYSLTDDFERWRNEFTAIARTVEIAADRKLPLEDGAPRLIETRSDWKFVGFVVLFLVLLALHTLGSVPFLRSVRSDEV